MNKIIDFSLPVFMDQKYTEETISFLEETFSRFITDNDLWDSFKMDPELLKHQFIHFAFNCLPNTID